jgi:putative sigma-54 modulation protein
MNIIIRGSQIEITEAIQVYLEKKLDVLSKFLNAESKIQADVGKISNHHKHGDIFKAELNIYHKGEYTRVEAEEEDLYAAIDAVKDEAYDALSSKKDKKQSLFRKGAQKIKQMFRK